MSDNSQTDTQENADIKQLRDKAKQYDALEARLAASERREAIRDAGIDTTSAMGQMFLKGYDGEVSVDAIKTKAIECGILPDPSATQSQGSAPTEPSGTRDRNVLATGGSGAGVGDVGTDVNGASASEAAQNIANGMRRDDAMAGLLKRRAAEAMAQAGVR